MTANELRIGNVVGHGALHTGIGRDGRDYYTINELREDVMFFNESNTGEYYNDVQPIPLTEDWLLEFGFEKLNRDVPAFEKGNLIVEWLFKMWTGMLYFDAYNSIQIIETKYVHQLQNLYFALTNEELKLKKL